MGTLIDSGLVWWVSAVDIPVLSGLFWLIWRVRRENEQALGRIQDRLDVRCSQLREALGAFKLEVAKSYTSVSDSKDLENRIVSHLLRIEAKLDRTALKAAAMRGDG